MCSRGHNTRCFIGRLCAVVTIAAGLASVAAPAAWAQSLQIGPANPAFEAWRDGRIPQAKSGDYALGYIPVPWKQMQVKEDPGAKGTKAPASYDLRSLGEVTPVKNQGNCGSCWTFATYGSAESWLLKNLDETWNFSENNLKNYHGFDMGPCGGGNDYMSCAYLARGGGPVLEAHDPYHAYDDRPSPGGPKMKQIESMLRFPASAEIKDAVMNYGALSVSLWWDADYYNSGDSTYYCPDSIENMGSLLSNHAVTLVGWDDAKVVTGGPQADPLPGAWIIKNSWGTFWGESGYFYISYYDTNAVVPTGGAYVFGPMSEPDTYSRIYQYDELGACDFVGYTSATPETCWGANVFTSDASEDLVAVGFYAGAPNSTYTVYVYDTFSGSHFSDLLASKSGSLPLEGYYTVALDTPVPLTLGDEFALVLEITTPGWYRPIAVERVIADFSSGVEVNAGESYVSSNGTAWDAGYTGDPDYDINVCLKGFTAPVPAGTVAIADSILPGGDLAMPFPKLEVGLSVTEQVVVQNTDTVNDLSVTSIELGSAVAEKAMTGAFSLGNVPSLPALITPGGSITFDVTFAPTWHGEYEDELLIGTNDSGNPVITVALSGVATNENLPVAGTAALALLAVGIAGGAMAGIRRRHNK